jgi:hypothetical protein
MSRKRYAVRGWLEARLSNGMERVEYGMMTARPK